MAESPDRFTLRRSSIFHPFSLFAYIPVFIFGSEASKAFRRQPLQIVHRVSTNSGPINQKGNHVVSISLLILVFPLKVYFPPLHLYLASPPYLSDPRP